MHSRRAARIMTMTTTIENNRCRTRRTPRMTRGVLFLSARSVTDALGGDDTTPVRTAAHDLAHGAMRAAANDAAFHIGLRHSGMRDVGEAGRRQSARRGRSRCGEGGEAKCKGGSKSKSNFLHG